jgi:hypothetical protein
VHVVGEPVANDAGDEEMNGVAADVERREAATAQELGDPFLARLRAGRPLPFGGPAAGLVAVLGAASRTGGAGVTAVAFAALAFAFLLEAFAPAAERWFIASRREISAAVSRVASATTRSKRALTASNATGLASACAVSGTASAVSRRLFCFFLPGLPAICRLLYA